MRPSAFDPAPTPLPLRAAAAIALVLLGGVGLSVMEYLESAHAVEAAPTKPAPKPGVEQHLPESTEWPYAEPLTSTRPAIFVPYQGG
ncbi:MAG: hypothetical protein RL277_1961 [Planctomycetota bacterium]|jgi:hypothetical protein